MEHHTVRRFKEKLKWPINEGLHHLNFRAACYTQRGNLGAIVGRSDALHMLLGDSKLVVR